MAPGRGAFQHPVGDGDLAMVMMILVSRSRGLAATLHSRHIFYYARNNLHRCVPSAEGRRMRRFSRARTESKAKDAASKADKPSQQEPLLSPSRGPISPSPVLSPVAGERSPTLAGEGNIMRCDPSPS
jgi:hypothetical protein